MGDGVMGRGGINIGDSYGEGDGDGDGVMGWDGM